MKTSEKPNAKGTIPLIVTTSHRGVFYGYGKPTDGDKIRLTNARMVVRWTGTKGLLGLASAGSTPQCRITQSVPAITLNGVTACIECSEVAVGLIEGAPWG